MIQMLLPDPLNPMVSIGDGIAFLAFCAAFLAVMFKGERNGR